MSETTSEMMSAGMNGEGSCGAQRPGRAGGAAQTGDAAVRTGARSPACAPAPADDGAVEPSTAEPGAALAGAVEPGTADLGAARAGAVESGTAQLGAVEPAPAVTLPTSRGVFSAVAWRASSAEHLSLSAPGARPGRAPLVRLHSECLTGDVLGSRRCDCGPQLDRALEMVQDQGGAVVYLRNHEGRGIGLVNKMRAYREQELGADTVDANEVLGLPADARSYGDAAAILRALGLTRIRLLTNNPAKVEAMEAEGIEVVGREPIEVGAHPESIRYLRTKRDRMNHSLTGLN